MPGLTPKTKPLEGSSGLQSCCAPGTGKGVCCPLKAKAVSLGHYLLYFLGFLLACLFTWKGLPPMAVYLSSKVGTRGTGLAAALEFFLVETPQILLLLTMVVFFVGISRTFFTPERTRKILSGQGQVAGHFSAALFGVVTPFCSCSAVPLFIGFVTSGVPLGITFTFLIAAPMVNEVALVLLFGLFPWKVAALYLGTGLAVSLIAGWLLGRMRLEKYIEPWVFSAQAEAADAEPQPTGILARLGCGVSLVRDIVGKVWPYVVLGIGIGGTIHGYVPENFMTHIMGKHTWWSVPAAVLLGVPMYSNAPSIMPVVQALLGKGAALGTTLAFMMAVIGLSLPEAIILRKVLKLPLLLGFFGIVALGIVLLGYLLNWLL